jgi:hypothetical protein
MKADKILLAKARDVEVVDPFEDSKVLRLEARFHELRRQANVMVVEVAAELGGILVDLKKVLRGRYLEFVRTRLGILPTTASNYQIAHRLAKESPAVIERWKHLGAGKIYGIARLEPARRHELLKRSDLDDLDDRTFASLTRVGGKKTRKVTGNMRGHGLAQAVEAFTRRLRKGVPELTSTEIRANLMFQLEELTRAAADLRHKIS